MFRTTDIVLIAVMVAGAAFTYNTKHQVEGQLADVRKIEAAIRFEQDSLTILKADWSLLTQPSRLQKLTEIYQEELQLAPLDARQIVGVDELPAKPVEMEIVPTPRIEGMAQDRTDKVTTGGVVQ
ncbi:MAG: hypothetical protein M9939_18640 [Mesorhizobium sp.]|nr:hypothetical protein [Mesorhizobium sp.]MCO5163156.1 hypothetical protein [Mesorhizobium sp.]